MRQRFPCLAPALVALVLSGCGNLKERLATRHEEMSYEEMQSLAASFVPAVGRHGGDISLALFADPQSFSPMAYDDLSAREITDLMYEGLTRPDGVGGEPAPALADQWVVSDDGLHWMFSLRPGLRWSDGAPITAGDVVFTYEQVILTGILGDTPARTVLSGSGTTLQVSAVDSVTVHCALSAPFAPLLHVMSMPILPRHRLQRFTEQGVLRRALGLTASIDSAVGSGPFVLASYEPNSRIVLERNPHYWRRDKAGNRLPYLDRVVYSIASGQDDELVRLGWAEVDFLAARGQDYPFLRKNERGGTYRTYSLGPARGSNFIAFNLNTGRAAGKPYVDPVKLAWFTSLDFRKAIAHAIDRNAIIREACGGRGFPQHSVLGSAHRRFHAPDLATYPYDTARARALLADRGFTDRNGDGVVEDAEGNPVSFALATNGDNGFRAKTARIIRDNLHQVGIRVNVRLVDFAAFSRTLTTAPYGWEAALVGVADPLDPSYAWNVWHSSGPLHLWRPRQQSPATPWEARIDSLLLAAVRERDSEMRAAAYGRWQHVAADSLPVIPTVLPERVLCISARFGNVNPSPLGGLLHNIDELFVVAPRQASPPDHAAR